MKYQGERLHTLLSGEYVLGLLAGAARRRFERLMMDRAELRAAVLAWEQRLAVMALKLEPVAPPDYMWWRIVGRIRSEVQPRRDASRLTLWRVWALAATLVLAVVMVTQHYLPTSEMKPATMALISDKAGKPMWLISVHPEDKRIDMKALADMAPPAGKSYELWLLPQSGAPHPMGLMNPTGVTSKKVNAQTLSDLVNAKALAISLEPAGGSPTGQPTGPVLWVASLVST
jgi:anti-sigma-K factor RskA